VSVIVLQGKPEAVRISNGSSAEGNLIMAEISEAIAQQLEKITPTSLDDVIRTNKDRARLYLSTEAELAALQGTISNGTVTGEIADWCFITFALSESQWSGVSLIGFNEAEHSSWMTSMVIAINDSTVLTKSGSTYTLVGESSTEPDLFHICATLNHWGLGQRLGVPPIFF
jgi:hypothetical protein